MGFAEEMTNLGENILGSFDARINFLGKNIVDVKNHKLDTQSLMKGFHKAHKAMGNKLRADLGAFTENLTDSVDTLRHKFQKEQKAVHQECKSAHQSWQKTGKTLANKRRNFKGALSSAKQKASRAH